MFASKRWWFGGLALAALVGWWSSPPADFPLNHVVQIKPGLTLPEISRVLRDAGVIRSGVLWSSLIRLAGADERVAAGDYSFEKKLFAWQVAERLIEGEFTTNPLKVTLPEGLSNEGTATILGRVLPNFDKEKFLTLAVPLTGRLFPDTYFFAPALTELQVVDNLKRNFVSQIKKKAAAIKNFGRPLEEVLVMASLIEREAREPAARRLISGILWRRLDAGMPLQVDVAPVTYRARGLPAQPIANVGLDAIDAALNPTISPYWYYLSDRQGSMHYAQNFDEHRLNRAKYLN